jgi:hypothetical protein
MEITMSEFTMNDMLSSVIDKKPESFKDAFNSLMAQKAIDALENKKQDVAKSMFGDFNHDNTEDSEADSSQPESNDLDLEDENVDNS